MTPEAIQHELAGLRALARSLVHGRWREADADDLMQDAALAALEHPPVDDRPVDGWLATVLRNRWRMIARGAARRDAREAAIVDARDDRDVEVPPDALDRVRTLERLAAALAALEEPFRTTVIRRYLDGETAAQIARALGVPAGTVRWRLKTGLERLRAALEVQDPRWQRALVPLIGVPVKAKSTAIVIAIVLLLLGATVLFFGFARDPATPRSPATAPIAAGSARAPRDATIAMAESQVAVADPLPGQGKPALVETPGEPGSMAGRVINWSTGEGVANADLTFSGPGGAVTLQSKAGGAFELAPAVPGRFTLTAITAADFLPYAPELSHSNVHVDLTKERAVRGITIFLFPALDYRGRVVDDKGAPVANAKVRLLGTPAGEQVLEKLETEWTTDKDGTFVFHAADDAVLEAIQGARRGWAALNGDAQVTHELTIPIGAAAARDATIAGRVIDPAGKPLADVLIRAEPDGKWRKPDDAPVATAFATTDDDGKFVLEHLDRGTYELLATDDDHASLVEPGVTAGSRDVTLTLDPGKAIAGNVTTTDGKPVPAYTLLVFAKRGVARDLISAQSIVEANGRFEVRVSALPGSAGDYELLASATGWAPSAPTRAAVGDTAVKLVLSAGATLRGRVIGADGKGIQYARITREARSGGASAQPANAGTVTRADGTFELTGIPPGPVSVTVGAGGFHPKIESGMTASDGATLGPITIALVALGPGEKPTLELVGIGVALSGDGDALRVDKVIDGGGAADAGIVAGDRVTAVDGISTSELGMDGAISRIRGTVGTTVSLTLKRGEQQLQLVVTRKKLRA